MHLLTVQTLPGPACGLDNVCLPLKSLQTILSIEFKLGVRNISNPSTGVVLVSLAPFYLLSSFLRLCVPEVGAHVNIIITVPRTGLGACMVHNWPH